VDIRINGQRQGVATNPFTSLTTPWMLQGVLLICVMRGSPPFWGDASADFSSASGPISGTALFAVITGIWLATLLLLLPGARWSLSGLRDNLVPLSIPMLALLSTVWSSAPRISFGEGFELLLITIAGICIANKFRPEQQVKLFVITGVIAALSSLLIVAVAPQTGLDQYGHVGAVKGIFTHKNTCGAFMLILMTPAFFLPRTSTLKRLGAWAYGLLCALLVALSQSRTYWILLILLLIVAGGLPALRKFKSYDAVFIAVTSVIAAVPLGWLLYANFSALVEIIGKDPSISGRTMIWQAVLAAIAKRTLLGYGYMAFFSSAAAGRRDLALAVGFSVNHAHNGYLAVWLDLGLIGLACLIVCVLTAARDAIRSWRSDTYTDWYICLILLVLVSNIDERGLMAVNDLSWLLFVVACAGLHRSAGQLAGQSRASRP